MSKPGRNDRHNTDPMEGKLIRIGHYLWVVYKQDTEAEKALSLRRTRNSLAGEARVPR